MCRESGEIKVESADLSASPGSLVSLLNDFPYRQLAKCVALEVEMSADRSDHDYGSKYHERPAGYFPPSHDYS
jgi:hypothetical protein